MMRSTRRAGPYVFSGKGSESVKVPVDVSYIQCRLHLFFMFNSVATGWVAIYKLKVRRPFCSQHVVAYVSSVQSLSC